MLQMGGKSSAIRVGALAVTLAIVAQVRTLSAGACFICNNFTYDMPPYGTVETGECDGFDFGYFDCALMTTENGSQCEADLDGCGGGGGS